MLKELLIPFLLFLTSCESVPSEEEYYDYPIHCDRSHIEYCEGISPRSMKCECYRIQGEYGGVA
jgi:hypothetical protein